MKSTRCVTCGLFFATPTTLLRHERSVHEMILPVACPICGKTFRDNYCYVKHFPTHTRPAKDAEPTVSVKQEDPEPLNPAIDQSEGSEPESKRRWRPSACECYVCEQRVDRGQYKAHMKEHAEELRQSSQELKQLVQVYYATFEKINSTVASFVSQI